MLTSYTTHFNGRIAFHLYLLSERKGNFIYSSFLPELLNKHYKREIYHLKNAMIINHFAANRLLEELAQEVLRNKAFQPFFYPNFIKGNFEVADKLISLQSHFQMTPQKCYWSHENSTELYYLQQLFRMNFNYAKKTSNSLDFSSFKKKYLIADEAKRAWRTLSKNSSFYSFFEYQEEGVVCGVVAVEEKLELLISKAIN